MLVRPIERPLASRYAVPDGLLDAVPAERPLASRKMVWELPEAFAVVIADPEERPLASRYCVCTVLPDEVLRDVLMTRPALSRSTVLVLPPGSCLRSMC